MANGVGCEIGWCFFPKNEEIILTHGINLILSETTTLSETNMTPENRPFQMEIHLPTDFQGRAVSFREGNIRLVFFK